MKRVSNPPTIDMPLPWLKQVVAKRELREKSRLERRKIERQYITGRIANMEFEKFLDEHPNYVLGQS